MSLSDDETFLGDDETFLGDDEQWKRGGPAPTHSAHSDDELGQFVSTQNPDPDGGTFDIFQQAALASDARADAHAAQAAARDAARVITDQARYKKQVEDTVDLFTYEDMRYFYDYFKRSPGEQVVIDRYILGFVNPDPKIKRSLTPPYGMPYYKMGRMGGYKSKSKSKKSRYNKKSKTNKMRRSRSNKRHRSRSNKRHR
jgi:hypothetical protein